MESEKVEFSLRSGNCYYIDWYLQIWDCPYWYTGGEEGYSIFCTLNSSTYVGTTLFCEDDGNGNGGYDGGGGGGNNGNGGGSASLSTQAQAIISSFNLNNNGINNLNAILAAMLEKCGYEFVYNYLKNNNCSFYNVLYNPNTIVGGYDPYTNILTFTNENAITNAFPEEFLHLYQNSYYSGGIGQYSNTGYSNIEFESKIMQDIICVLSGGLCPKYGATQNNGSDYLTWIFEITNNASTFPTYTDLLVKYPNAGNKNYWDFLNDFANDSSRPQYNIPIDYNLLPYALTNLHYS